MLLTKRSAPDRRSQSSAPSRSIVLGTGATGRPVLLTGRQVATHKRVWGLTGSGKSMFLAALAVQLLNNGIACAVIDPHGDLVEDILRILLKTGYFEQAEALERLRYVDFGGAERFPAFNVLAQPYDDHMVARDLLTAFKRAWSSLEGGQAPALENTILAAALVLIQNRLPVTEMPRLLIDGDFRGRLLTRVSDPEVVRFFETRYDRAGKGVPATIESSLRRLFILTYSPALRHSLGNATNQFDLRRLMDRGVSLLCNLSGLDEDSQKLLGCLLTVGFERAALSRADIVEERRRPYHLILDEFSQFSAQSQEALARVLDLTRKFGLSLTLSHQTGSQLPARLDGALQNALEIAFRLGHTDAQSAAGRLFNYDPTALRSDPLGIRSRPAYASAHEQIGQLAVELERLPARHAYIRIAQRTERIRALTVATDGVEDELQAVLDGYAARLPPPPVRDGGDAFVRDESEAPRRLRRRAPLAS